MTAWSSGLDSDCLSSGLCVLISHMSASQNHVAAVSHLADARVCSQCPFFKTCLHRAYPSGRPPIAPSRPYDSPLCSPLVAWGSGLQTVVFCGVGVGFVLFNYYFHMWLLRCHGSKLLDVLLQLPELTCRAHLLFLYHVSVLRLFSLAHRPLKPHQFRCAHSARLFSTS